jgi:hypothetical protein
MFVRGRTNPNDSTQRTPVPIGFVADPDAPNSYTDWVYQRNDPYMSGWAVDNIGTKNNDLPGDVVISWFKPADSSMDNAADNDDQLYFMVVNGFAGYDGSAADYRQEIKINFLNTTATQTLQRLNADTGQVDVLSLPVVNTRRQLVIQLDGGEGALLKFNTGDPFIGVEPSADFDVDGDVDGADFLRWQRGFGASGGATHGQADAELDLDVDGADLGFWKSQLGSATGATTAVPEPCAWIIFSTSLAAVRRRPARF